MSAPDTNTKTQEKRHKGALVGMPLAAGIATVLFLAVLAWVAFSEPRTSAPAEPLDASVTTGAAATE